MMILPHPTSNTINKKVLSISTLILILVVWLQGPQQKDIIHLLFLTSNYIIWAFLFSRIFTWVVFIYSSDLKRGKTVRILLFQAIGIISSHWILSNILFYLIRGSVTNLSFLPTIEEVKGFFLVSIFNRIFDLILLSGIISWIYQNRTLSENQKKLHEKEIEIQKNRLKSLKNQLNPHFLFNTLNHISILTETNTEKAQNMIHNTSQVLRKILDFNESHFHTLKEEWNFTLNYLEIEKERFHDRFNLVVSIDKQLNTITVPVMLIQPLAENAIKHGLVHKKEQGNLWITIRKETTDLLIVTIEDDGIGREKSSEINKKRQGHKSFAVNATQERVSLYKQEKLFDISVEFTDKVDENNKATGTVVTLKIKRI